MRSISRLLAIALLAILSLPVSAQDKEEAKPKQAYVGVSISYGEKKDTIVVRIVLSGSPAEKAGLEGGDRIISIDGAKPTTILAAVTVMRSLKPGKKVKLLIERNGKEKVLDLVPVGVDD